MSWGASLLRKLTRKPAATLGERGERAAAAYLRRHGHRILGKNLRNRLGEIDLLALDRRTGAVVIVEVKTTRGDDPPPEIHVNPAKQRKLTSLAGQLARQHRLGDRTIRFDVIGIVWAQDQPRPTRITHHANAFDAAF